MHNSARYFVHSSYVNAWSIQRGLVKLGRRLECASASAGLLTPSLQQPTAGDVLFFTDERMLQKHAGDARFTFLPQQPDLPVDDKLEFALRLQAIDEQPIPYWPHLDEAAEWPILVKCRHSWHGDDKLPRGYICHSPAQWQAALSKIDQQGLPRSFFFQQRLISGELNNYSTCGFFDFENPTRSCLAVTRRTLDTGAKIGTAAIVETIDDPQNLLERTQRLLTELRFTGPFELEFLYDVASANYYVLELNPRFWMQHGLFVDAGDNRLIQLYLGLDLPDDRAATTLQPAIWLSTIDFVKSCLAFKLRMVCRYAAAYCRAKTTRRIVCTSPDLPTAVKHVGRIIGKGLLKRVRRWLPRHPQQEIVRVNPPQPHISTRHSEAATQQHEPAPK